MKKIILITGLAILLAGCDGITPDIQNNDLMQPTHEYEIDTWGANSEVYEFTPLSNSGYTCVMLALDNMSAVGLQCFPKGSDK